MRPGDGDSAAPHPAVQTSDLPRGEISSLWQRALVPTQMPSHSQGRGESFYRAAKAQRESSSRLLTAGRLVHRISQRLPSQLSDCYPFRTSTTCPRESNRNAVRHRSNPGLCPQPSGTSPPQRRLRCRRGFVGWSIESTGNGLTRFPFWQC